MHRKHELVSNLLEIKAVQISLEHYFTWTSGIESPIYCDNRLTMGHPDVRNKITDYFIQLINQLDVRPDVIAGCATAGIPHAAWLANRLDLPMVYVRGETKGHGKGNQMEGEIKKGQKVLMIEDLISTGGSSIKAAQAVEQSNAEVIAVFAIFSYGLKQAETNFSKANFHYQTITDFDALIETLLVKEELTETDKNNLLEWRNQS